jgi:hypothetical protein
LAITLQGAVDEVNPVEGSAFIERLFILLTVIARALAPCPI